MQSKYVWNQTINIPVTDVRTSCFLFSWLLRLVLQFTMCMSINKAKIFMISDPAWEIFLSQLKVIWTFTHLLIKTSLHPNSQIVKDYYIRSSLILTGKSCECFNYSPLRLSISTTSSVKASLFFFCKNCQPVVREPWTVFSIMHPCVMKALAFPLSSVDHIIAGTLN